MRERESVCVYPVYVHFVQILTFTVLMPLVLNVTAAYKITALSSAYWMCNSALANFCCWRLHVVRTRNGEFTASGDKQKTTRKFP